MEALDVLEIRHRLSTVQKTLEDWLPCFSSQGLEFRGCWIDKSQAVGMRLKCRIVSPDSGVQIEVRFTPGFQERKDIFSVTILSEDGRYFLLRHYLKYVGRAQDIEKLGRDENETLRSFVESFKHFFTGLVEHDLADVLNGKLWPDIPIDWDGYK